MSEQSTTHGGFPCPKHRPPLWVRLGDNAALVIVGLVLAGGLATRGYVINESARGWAWFGCALLGCWGLTGAMAGRWKREWNGANLLVALLMLIGVVWWGIQLIPLPAETVTSLSPAWAATAESLRAAGLALPERIPLAQDPASGAASWHQLIAALGFFLGVVSLASRRSNTIRLVAIALVVWAIEALLGLADWMKSEARPHGALHNPNHHATMVAMFIPLYFAALAVWSNRSRRLSGDIAGGGNPLLLLAGLGLLLSLSWLVTLSRGSILIGGAVILVWAALEWWVHARRYSALGEGRMGVREYVAVAGMAGAALIVLALLADAANLAEGIARRGDGEVTGWLISDAGRLEFWRATLAGLMERPLLGLGPAGAETAITRFMQASAEQTAIWSHNDYVQVVAEMGIPVSLTGLALLSILAAQVVRDVRLRRDAFDWSERVLQRAAAAGVILALLHAVVEFHLRIPLAGFSFLILAALALGPGPLLVTGLTTR